MAEKLPILIADSQAVSRAAIQRALTCYEGVCVVDVCAPEDVMDNEAVAERCIALGTEAAAILVRGRGYIWPNRCGWARCLIGLYGWERSTRGAAVRIFCIFRVGFWMLLIVLCVKKGWQKGKFV